MNDNKLNFWGHNSNFTDAQVKVPFAIFGPGISKDNNQWNLSTLTSHQDVVPTLMREYLGVENDFEDYSIGENLLGNEVERSWVMSSSYSAYAIISDKQILEVNATGQYQLLDKSNRQIKGGQPNFVHMQEALEAISRFNK